MFCPTVAATGHTSSTFSSNSISKVRAKRERKQDVNDMAIAYVIIGQVGLLLLQTQSPGIVSFSREKASSPIRIRSHKI